MKTALAAIAAVLCAAGPSPAHRLDKYLQATLISVEKDRIQAEIRLTPGVAVFSFVLSMIDSNADGVISESEQRIYAERVLRDLSLKVDGNRLHPALVSMKFPEIDEMKEGLGEIRLELRADLFQNSPNRKLLFENHHQSRIAAYLVNCLVPRDPQIQVMAQNRNESQSTYELDYRQAGVRSSVRWPALQVWLAVAALLLSARIVWLGYKKSPNMFSSSSSASPDMALSAKAGSDSLG